MLDLSKLVIETPSWGYADSGTRFGVFPQPGRPRNTFEKLDDAAEVHRLTGTAAKVALHFPWDAVDDYDELRAEIESRGLQVGAVNPNLFQDPDYKLGSVTHPDPAVREKAIAHMLECVEIATALGATAQSLWLADGTNYPGQDDLRERRRRMMHALTQVYAALPDEQELLVEYKFFEPAFYATDLADWGSRAADVPEARRAREGARGPRPSRPGHEHRADRGLPRRRGAPRRLPLQQPQVRRRRPDRRLGEPVRAVPDLRRADGLGRAAAPDDRPVAQHRGQGRGDDALASSTCRRPTPRRCSSTARRWAQFQRAGDVLGGHEVLLDAFNTDVRPACAEARVALGGAENPIRALRESGYAARMATERESEQELTR